MDVFVKYNVNITVRLNSEAYASKALNTGTRKKKKKKD